MGSVGAPHCAGRAQVVREYRTWQTATARAPEYWGRGSYFPRGCTRSRASWSAPSCTMCWQLKHMENLNKLAKKERKDDDRAKEMDDDLGDQEMSAFGRSSITGRTPPQVSRVETEEVTGRVSPSKEIAEESPTQGRQRRASKVSLESSIYYSPTHSEVGSQTAEAEDDVVDLISPERQEKYWQTLGMLDLETPEKMQTWSFGSPQKTTEVAKSGVTLAERGKGLKKRKMFVTSPSPEVEARFELGKPIEKEREHAETVESGVREILKLVEELRKNVEQNTKKEIKKAIQMLQRHAERLKQEEVKQYLRRAARGTVQRVVLEEKGVQTDVEETEEDKKKREEREEEEEIEAASTYEEWTKVATKKWKQEHYKRTQIKEGNPLWRKDGVTKVVLVEENDRDMVKSIQSQYLKNYPELAEIEEECEEIERTTITKVKGEERRTTERVIRLNVGEVEDEIWRKMEMLKQRTDKEEVVAIHHLKTMSLSRLRKMVEVVFKQTQTKVEIYTTQAKMEEEKTAETQKRQRNTYALIVERPGKTYQEIVRGIKEQMEGRQEADIIQGVRMTRDKKVIITTGKDIEAFQAIQGILRKGEGQKVSERGVREVRKTKVLYVRGMIAATEQVEVKEAIEKKLGKVTEEDFRVSALRPYAGSLLAATVQLKKEEAEELLNNKSIRVGLADCRIEERQTFQKCLKCWSLLHLVKDCKNEDRRQLCYNCGETGHLGKDCENSTKCLDCNSDEHRAGSTRCAKFRQELRDRRKKLEERKKPERGDKESKDIVELNRSEDENDQEEEKMSTNESLDTNEDDKNTSVEVMEVTENVENPQREAEPEKNKTSEQKEQNTGKTPKVGEWTTKHTKKKKREKSPPKRISTQKEQGKEKREGAGQPNPSTQ